MIISTREVTIRFDDMDGRLRTRSSRHRSFETVSDLKTIRFDYDKYFLSEGEREILGANAAYLRRHPDFDVLIEGHCDERGTIEYNIALGQQRAKTVKDYYVRLGIPARIIDAISYGKEKPPCVEQTELCWERSRRVVTLIHIPDD